MMIDRGCLAAILHAVVATAGSRQRAAKQLGVSAQYLGDVLHGRRDLSGKIVTALGYRRVVLYEQVQRKPSRPSSPQEPQ